MTTDPPTRYYAPQVRVVDTGNSDALIGLTHAEGAKGASTQVHLDVMSATVTLVNTGISQVQLVLNNQMFRDGMPTTPPWKYNGLDRVKFGQRLRVDMTYGGQPWTKMILAQVNSIKFTFPSGGAGQVTVTGEDLGCLLKRNPETDKPYPAGQNEQQIVADVVARATGPKFAGANVVTGERDADGWVETRGSLIAWPTFSQALPAVTHQKSQTFMKFLESMAERLDYEIFVDFAKNFLPADDTGPSHNVPAGASTPKPDKDANEVLLHFEPARSLLRGGSPPTVVDLKWGLNIADFTPTLKIWDLFTGVKVSGRSNATVERVKESIDSEAEVDGIIAEDLGSVPSGGSPWRLVPATELRRTMLKGLGTDIPESAPTDVDFTNLDRERGLQMAKAKLLGKAREMCSVEVQTIGFPSLRPGSHVNVSGFNPPFDGLYYVTKTVHTLDSGGYRTQLSLRRPGMQDPGLYTWAQVGAS